MCSQNNFTAPERCDGIGNSSPSDAAIKSWDSSGNSSPRNAVRELDPSGGHTIFIKRGNYRLDRQIAEILCRYWRKDEDPEIYRRYGDLGDKIKAFTHCSQGLTHGGFADHLQTEK